MASDQQCWHCGKTLSANKVKSVNQPPLTTAAPEATESPTPLMPPLRTIMLYVGLTAMSLLILITTTRAIGQAPLFLFGSNSVPLDGWRPVTDSQRQFALNLPKTWHHIELDRTSEAASLRNSPPLQALSGTFDALVADTELLLVGTEDTAVFAKGSPVFVLVAQSERLQRLSPDEIISYAQEQLPESVTLVEANTTEGITKELTGNLLFNIQQGEQLWRCREQIVPGDGSTYLIATCTSFAQFPIHLDDFEAILRSFQPLGS